jgi:hypothetical protein
MDHFNQFIDSYFDPRVFIYERKIKPREQIYALNLDSENKIRSFRLDFNNPEKFRVYTIEFVDEHSIRLYQIGNTQDPLIFLRKDYRPVLSYRGPHWSNWSAGALFNTLPLTPLTEQPPQEQED